MSVVSDKVSPKKPRQLQSGYAASSTGWVREPWEQELLEKIASRGEMRAEALEKRFRERLQLRIAEEHAKLDHMKKKSEEIGTFLREEDFWSDDEGRGTTRTRTLNPMEQLQALKNRFALIDSVSSPKQPERTPSQTTPTVEEHHFMMLRTLRQSLTLFYEAVSPENLGKVDQLLQIFVSRGCSQKAYSDLNNELRMAYGRDLAGTVDEEPVNLYSTLPPEELAPSRVARPQPAPAPEPPAHQQWDSTATGSSADTSTQHSSPPPQPVQSSDFPRDWLPPSAAAAGHHHHHPAHHSAHQSPARAPNCAPVEHQHSVPADTTVGPQPSAQRPIVYPAPPHTPPRVHPTVHPPARPLDQPRPAPEHVPMPPNTRRVNDAPGRGPGAGGGGAVLSEERGPRSPRWSGNAKLTVRAKWRYEPTNPDELRFAAGDIIHVRGESDDVPVHWYWGSCNGRKGLVPGNYVDVLQRDSQPRPFVVLPPPVPPPPAMGVTPASVPVRLVPSVQSTPAPSPPHNMRMPVQMVAPPRAGGGLPPGTYLVHTPMHFMSPARMVQQPSPYVDGVPAGGS